jgi:hypothetical protein
MLKRRFKQNLSHEERLMDEAMRLRAKAKSLPAGYKRDTLLRKARQDESAARVSEWLNSPGLRAPT